MRLGTRGSRLALAQAEAVARLIGDCEIVVIETSGDRISARESAGAGAADTDTPSPAAIGAGAPADKSRWVAELEQALCDGRVDLAVHSAKDLPGELADGLELLGAPARAAREDVLVGAGGLAELRGGARVGTSSVRRLAQVRAARADLEVVALSGNVDTRLRRLAEPARGLDAIVLARAGLERLSIVPSPAASLEPERFVPAPGQGVLALEGRAEDQRARVAARSITDQETLVCLHTERSLARELGASCHTPLGAMASCPGAGEMHLRAWVGLPDGSEWAGDELLGRVEEPERLAREVAGRLRAVGAAALLERAQQMAAAA